MHIGSNRRYYLFFLAALALLSAYPLINGARMAYLSLTQGAIEQEQYAKYVAPYAAICLSLLCYAALQPLSRKLKRLAFPAGLAAAYGIFLLAERFIETIQVHVRSMTLIDAATLTPQATDAAATVDIWQASLCIASPVMREQAQTYVSQESFFYVLGDGSYKIHYYLISLLLITMIGGLLYELAGPPRAGTMSHNKPLLLRLAATAALVALCVFANTTAFFRQTAPIQTALASLLTGLFFVTLGTAAGLYAGSFLLKKDKALAIGGPVLCALAAAVLMYIGEALMMQGNLYRFGTGWFFDGLCGLVLAPADILIILLAGAATWLILTAVRKNENRPAKRVMTVILALCLAVALGGPLISINAPRALDDDSYLPAENSNINPPGSALLYNGMPKAYGFVEGYISGCYVVAASIYQNPLSSSAIYGEMPWVYGCSENAFIIAGTESGDIRSYSIEYCKTPVGADEFSAATTDIFADPPFAPPGISRYQERYLLAIISDDSGPAYRLYSMDNEIWLVDWRNTWIWSILRLAKTSTTTLADLRRALEHYEEEALRELPSGMYESPPRFYENQLTLQGVYGLARKGEALTLEDFAPFHYWLCGADFTVRRYDVVGADTVYVRAGEEGLESALLMSRRTNDPEQAVDLREGFAALTEYMNPLKALRHISIEEARFGVWAREMFFEDDYFGSECRYYLYTRSAGHVYAIFEGERMTIAQALQERRVSVEELVANGLRNVSMIPIENPLGGEFTVLNHPHTFKLEGEAFFPSKTFRYVVFNDKLSVYYDTDELSQILELYGYPAVSAQLRSSIGPEYIMTIARGNYVSAAMLATAGIVTEVGRPYSSQAYSTHTPVTFLLR
jgi:hypothetical protein